MDHREAKRLLVDLAAGELDQSTRNEVTAHVEECVACRAWLETRDLLASLAPVENGIEHPESDLLAEAAARPEALDEPGGSVVREHLEICASCRREVELVRDALLASRPDAAHPGFVGGPRQSRRWWYVAAAAFIGVIALRFFLPAETTNRRVVDLQPGGAVAPVVESTGTWTGSPVESITGEEINGTRLIEAEGSLTLSRVKITDGAKVTIFAGDVVAFGDGFQIGSGTSVTVGTVQSEAPAADDVS